jgi:hypothetical protein
VKALSRPRPPGDDASLRRGAAPRGRTPRATNISSFYDGHNGSRNPGAWPTLLRRSWEERYGQTQPYPYGPDNMTNRGSRASQYTS